MTHRQKELDMDRSRLAAVTLRLDAVANVALAVALVALATPLARAVGLSPWLLAAVAAAIVVNGALCWIAAAAPRPDVLRRLAAVDVVFAAAMFALAALDPGAAVAPARWGMAALGDIVAVVALVKLWCARDLRVGASA